MSWQDISTVPKDGTKVLLCWFDNSNQIVGWWIDNGLGQEEFGRFSWATLEGPHYDERVFSHWMPLPDYPADNVS